MDVLAEIDRVLALEASTLSRVREHVGPAYEQAVRLLDECPGKVFVAGVGKSGLIARKIASTMVTSGVPAIFLHPGDALHGDLGIARHGDVLLAVSKSGESDEVLALLPALRRLGVRIIAITASPSSTVARSAEVVLYTPIDEEACPVGLTPTCSTTAALAVGDALAVALMRKRGFGREQLALHHPAGQLGKRLLLEVRDVMRSGDANPVLPLDAGVRTMLLEITRQRCGAVSVVDAAGHLLGLVTDYDVRRALERGGDFLAMGVAAIMNPRPTSVYADEMAYFALELMQRRERPFLVLPVLDRTDRVVGMLHLHDLVARGL